jgi:hypothetical protein
MYFYVNNLNIYSGITLFIPVTRVKDTCYKLRTESSRHLASRAKIESLSVAS